LEKDVRKITFINYIEDEKVFRSKASRRTEWRAKEHLRSLLTHEYNYEDLLKVVPNIFVKSIQEIIFKNFSKASIKNLKIKHIFGGLSNSKLYQLNDENKKYILRLLDNNRKIEVRQSEIAAHKAGAQMKIAPTLIDTDKLALVILMDFIDGRTMSKQDFNDKFIVGKVIENIKKFHNCKIEYHLLNKTKIDTIKEAYAYYLTCAL